MAEREGVTEQLKANNQMEWVAQMNNIRNRVTEIVKMIKNDILGSSNSAKTIAIF